MESNRCRPGTERSTRTRDALTVPASSRHQFVIAHLTVCFSPICSSSCYPQFPSCLASEPISDIPIGHYRRPTLQACTALHRQQLILLAACAAHSRSPVGPQYSSLCRKGSTVYVIIQGSFVRSLSRFASDPLLSIPDRPISH